MATKPAVKKVKNGSITKNGKPKLKAMNESQLVDAINKTATSPSKNTTSKFGKLLAKMKNVLFRKQHEKKTCCAKKSSS